MDFTIFLGFLVIAGIFYETIISNGNAGLFYSSHAFIVVVGGILAVTLINFPFSQMKMIGVWFRVLFFPKTRNHRADILFLIKMSYQIHRQGLPSLEQNISNTKDNFLRYALIQIQQKTDPVHIRVMLREMVDSSEKRHEMGIHYFEQIAKYAPGLALVGTLLGLVQLLSNLDDPKSVGPNMATALVATFYGVGSSNLIFLPLADRLRVASYAERLHKEILIEGIMAIAKGELPIVVKEKIYSLVTEKDREYLRKFENN